MDRVASLRSQVATLALADAEPLPLSADGGIDAMGWLDPDQTEVIPICQAFEERRREERLRLKAMVGLIE